MRRTLEKTCRSKIRVTSRRETLIWLQAKTNCLQCQFEIILVCMIKDIDLINKKKCKSFKWVKYIINKNIEKHRSSYYLQRSLTNRKQHRKHFEVHFLLYQIYGSYHISKFIFELTLSAVCLHQESKKRFSSYAVTLILLLHVFSSVLLFEFSYYLQKKFLLLTGMGFF